MSKATSKIFCSKCKKVTCIVPSVAYQILRAQKATGKPHSELCTNCMNERKSTQDQKKWLSHYASMDTQYQNQQITCAPWEGGTARVKQMTAQNDNSSETVIGVVDNVIDAAREAAGLPTESKKNKPEKEEKLSKKQKKERALQAKKRRLKVLFLVRGWLEDFNKQEEDKERAKTITVLNQSNYAINLNTVEAFLVRVLSANGPTHINDIIAEIEKLGWRSTSIYHKYDYISHKLNKASYMFENLGKGIYQLRDGFKGSATKNEQPVRKKRDDSLIQYGTTLITLDNIVEDLVKALSRGKAKKTYPGEVWDYMRKMGFKCSYSSVYRAMQKPKYKREGAFYKIENKDVNAQNENTTSSVRQTD